MNHLKRLVNYRYWPQWVKGTFKWCWVSFATVLVLLAISLTVFRALTPWAAQYKGELETRLSTMFGAPVSIGEMKTSWYWFEPVLKLDNVEIKEHKKSVLDIKGLLVGIDLGSSLWHWRIQPGVLFVEDATLDFRQDKTGWQLDGIEAVGANANPMSPAEYSTALGWLLLHKKIVMKRVELTLHWEDGRVTPIKPLNLIASNNDGHYRVKGQASLTGERPSVLSVLADLYMPSGFSSDVRGQVYVAAEQVDFEEWKAFFDALQYRAVKGRGEVQLWLDIQHSRLVSGQAALRLRNLVWQKNNQKKSTTIDRFSANMAWEQTPDGWRLIADKVRFKANKVTWPENAITVTYQSEDDEYRFFVKSLLLEPVQELFQEALKPLKPWVQMHPKGQLSNTQIGIKASKLNYVLTRFSHLSWDANDAFPAVKNLSGALAWEPQEGRLDLDGEDVIINIKNKPMIEANLLNISVVWKALSHGYRINLDRGVLKHANGVFSARGVLDGARGDSPGTLQGNLAFSLHDATFWMAYLPESGLKPKLRSWLIQDITRIDQLSGQVKVKGPLEAFPFDTHPGEFLVSGSMDGVDLRFNSDWPVTKDISATLKLDKRTLAANITAADFQGLPLQAADLKVTDLGLDKEVLTVDGSLEGPVQDMQKYIATSPLSKRLSKLEVLRIREPAKLSLKVEYPFYPTDEGLSVNGQIAFDNNQLFLKEIPETFSLGKLSGALVFDTKGVINSQLTARLFEEPIHLRVHSYHGNDPHLVIDLAGHIAVTGLRDAISLPALQFMKGRTPFKGKIKITDDADDLDSVHFTSALEGLAIDLPEPFGKTRQMIAPLSIYAYFNLARGIQLKVDYDKRLQTDLWFEGAPSHLNLKRGELVVGGGAAALQDKPGAMILGEIKAFNWAAWKPVMDKLSVSSNQSTDSIFTQFKSLALTIHEMDVLGQHYKHVQLDGQRLSDNAWAIAMKEESVSADLTYIPNQRLITGQLSSLSFPKRSTDDEKAADSVPPSHLLPKDIPNLDISVEHLNIGEVDAGRLSIKGEAQSQTLWHLEAGQLKSDAYVFNVTGDFEGEAKNETRINGRLTINTLEQALNHWNISPVVEARSGDIQFNGAWNNSPLDFSLKTVTGKMKITFKEGRITHLSADTEKKIGLGKLLSILSLQTIPRRLKLDFSDLSKPGYFFDKFDGNFVVAHGIMDTEDSVIDGPVARATMKGSLNIDKQLYELSLHITPHITASLPIVATIAGGPVAGVATWVASKIINQGMEKISGYTYEVSGPWQEPVVQQVHIYKKQAVNTEN